MLVYSSLIFITNILSTWYYGYSFYSALFCCLTLTSIFFHSYGCLGYLDKLMILGITLHGIYVMYQKPSDEFPLILATFIIVCILYGDITQELCFGSEGDRYHAILHIISSIGHHLILL